MIDTHIFSKHISKLLLVAITFISTTLAVSAEITFSATRETPIQWRKIELGISGLPSVGNPYDPNQIAIDAIISTPSGKTLRLPAFWMQPYERALLDGYEKLTPTGNPGWRLRFTPSEAGRYEIKLDVLVNGIPLINTANHAISVTPAASSNQRQGFVRLSPDKKTLQTDDGRRLMLIGQNVCWPEGRGTYDYDRWLNTMADAGQNFFRIWMAPWFLPFEHQPDTLTNYPQDAAFQLDHLFEKADELGMYLMISFDHHGMFQLLDPTWGGSNAFWDSSNPYSTTNGGPCETPNDFFTSLEAKQIYQKRLRYLVARYGYSPQLLNWQFFNEIDNAFNRAPLNPEDVYAWHAEMADWFQAHDPYDHLVTTSLTGDSDRAPLWQISGLDYTMFHSYWDPAPARFNAQLSSAFIKAYEKPHMVGEFGTNAFNLNIDGDPHLRGFRQGLWGAIMGGSVGTSMTWWWEDVYRQHLEPIYQTIHDVLKAANWEQEKWEPLALQQTPQPTKLASVPVLPGKLPFSAELATTQSRRMNLSGKVAIANELAAKRSGEFLQSFLRPATDVPTETNLLDKLRRVPLDKVSFEIEACFASNAKLLLDVNGVESDTSLEILLNGNRVWFEDLVDTDGATLHSNELKKRIEIPIETGKHSIRMLNHGTGWIEFNSIRLERVQPSMFANNWTYEPEILGLLNHERSKAILYIVSPHVVYPAGAKAFNPPLVEDKFVDIPLMKPGHYSIQWVNPVDGTTIENKTITISAEGNLRVLIPPFRDDLSAYLQLLD